MPLLVRSCWRQRAKYGPGRLEASNGLEQAEPGGWVELRRACGCRQPEPRRNRARLDEVRFVLRLSPAVQNDRDQFPLPANKLFLSPSFIEGRNNPANASLHRPIMRGRQILVQNS